MKNSAKPSENQYHAMKLKNLQSALIKGKQSGDAGILDMQALKDKARKALNDKNYNQKS